MTLLPNIAQRALAVLALGVSPGAALAAGPDAVLRGAIDPAASEVTGTATLSAKKTGRALPVAKVQPQGADNQPAAAVENGARPATATDPYSALGIRLGSFLVLPSVEVTSGYSTNPSRAAGGSPAAVVTVAPQAILRSDWARHSASLTLRGAYEKSSDDSQSAKVSFGAEGAAHLDVSQDLGADLGAGYKLDHQNVTDPAFPAGADRPPAVHTITGAAALVRGIGPSEFTVKVDGSRSIYEDAVGSGVTIDQGDRNNAVGELRLRAGYKISPAVVPFAEAGIGRRVFDRTVNAGGYTPSGGIYLARVGFAFNDGPVLTGEGAVGWRAEMRDDERLPSLAGLTFDSSLVWSPTRLLTATLNAATLFSPQPDPASAGSIKYDLSADIAYLLRTNFTLHALASAGIERFDNGGIDLKYALGASADWRLNRTLGLTAKFTHEWTDAADTARDFTAETVNVGVRLQR